MSFEARAYLPQRCLSSQFCSENPKTAADPLWNNSEIFHGFSGNHHTHNKFLSCQHEPMSQKSDLQLYKVDNGKTTFWVRTLHCRISNLVTIFNWLDLPGCTKHDNNNRCEGRTFVEACLSPHYFGHLDFLRWSFLSNCHVGEFGLGVVQMSFGIERRCIYIYTNVQLYHGKMSDGYRTPEDLPPLTPS